MHDLRIIQSLMTEFKVEKVLQLNLDTCRELIQANPECSLIEQAIKVLQQTIADLEEDERNRHNK